jgi:hypothetical protein
MYSRRIIPDDFTPPSRFGGTGFHLRMLTVHDVVKDFDAVTSAAGHLRGAMDPDSTWPDGLTLEENLIDLGWHQREFTIGHSFAYTVMNDDESRCLGCCYIYPSATPGCDTAAFYWARDPDFDTALGATFRALVATFPFKRTEYPGREITGPENAIE